MPVPLGNGRLNGCLLSAGNSTFNRLKWMLVECWQFCLQLSKRHLLCTLSLWYKYKDKVSYIATLFATSGFVPSAITVFTFSAIQSQMSYIAVVPTSGSGHKLASLKDHLSVRLYSLASLTCDRQSSISKLSIKSKIVLVATI